MVKLKLLLPFGNSSGSIFANGWPPDRRRIRRRRCQRFAGSISAGSESSDPVDAGLSLLQKFLMMNIKLSMIESFHLYLLNNVNSHGTKWQ